VLIWVESSELIAARKNTISVKHLYEYLDVIR